MDRYAMFNKVFTRPVSSFQKGLQSEIYYQILLRATVTIKLG